MFKLDAQWGEVVVVGVGGQIWTVWWPVERDNVMVSQKVMAKAGYEGSGKIN